MVSVVLQIIQNTLPQSRISLAETRLTGLCFIIQHLLQSLLNRHRTILALWRHTTLVFFYCSMKIVFYSYAFSGTCVVFDLFYYYNFKNKNMGIYLFTCHTWTNTFVSPDICYLCINYFQCAFRRNLWFFFCCILLHSFPHTVQYPTFHLMGKMVCLSNLNH